MELIIKFTGEEAGASLLEYALLMAVIALGVAANVVSFSSAVANLFNMPWPN